MVGCGRGEARLAPQFSANASHLLLLASPRCISYIAQTVIGFLEIIQAIGLGIGLVFVLLLFWGLRRRRQALSTAQPSVSVLVAARNEEANLPRLLESLAAQNYASRLCEFIIVDDASTDRSSEIVEDWSHRDPRFKLLKLAEADRPTQGPKKRALSAGLAISRGDIILITDADCIAPPSWIREIVRRFDEETDAVCGLIRFRSNPSFWSRLAAFESAVNGILNAAVIGLGGALSCAGANFAYRRGAFQQAGGFDADSRSFSGDDDLLLQRMKSRGLRIQFCESPNAVIETAAPQDSKSYWRRKRRHLSAGSRYAAHWLILAALAYLGCLSSVLLCISAIFGYVDTLGFLWLWIAFSSTLLTFFLWGSSKFGFGRLRIWAIPGALIFPLFFAFLQPLTLLPAPEWKGRIREA